MTTEPKRLDASVKQPVQYCIPYWLRDQQIEHAIRTVKGRIEPPLSLNDEPIAVVGFGPSLCETWEKIKEFKHVVTCSGSHKFLIERGIVPTYHVEVDPRPHKVDLLGPPHPNVEYLIASTCHPLYFAHLFGFNVKLWHVFADEDDAAIILPRGEWQLTGGSNVGLRAMAVARFLGFRNQHVFGMDGCQRVEGRKHAAAHPLQDGQGHSITTYKGVEYLTTPSLLECARQTVHELDMMPDVEAIFHGDGLVQEMVKDRVPKNKKMSGTIAINRPVTISAEYAALNRTLHETNLLYGVGGSKHVETVKRLVAKLGSQSVLDYGCGKGLLAKALDYPIWEYDPAVPGKERPPRAADLVVCTDVLEHVEPDKLTAVLDDLRRVTRKIGYFVIHTGAASKTLPDGRNTHLIQQGCEWWLTKLRQFFVVPDSAVKESGPLLYVVVSPRKLKKVTRPVSP